MTETGSVPEEGIHASTAVDTSQKENECPEHNLTKEEITSPESNNGECSHAIRNDCNDPGSDKVDEERIKSCSAEVEHGDSNSEVPTTASPTPHPLVTDTDQQSLEIVDKRSDEATKTSVEYEGSDPSTRNDNDGSLSSFSAEDEHAALRKENRDLQKKMLDVVGNRPYRRNSVVELVADQDVTKRYNRVLSEIEKEETEINDLLSESDSVVSRLRTKVREKERTVANISKTFRGFKAEVARNAVDSRTGRPIPKKVLEEMEEKAESNDVLIEKERLRYISLRTDVRKIDSSIRDSDRLADGFSLKDYEQLRVENKKLRQKLERHDKDIAAFRDKHETSLRSFAQANSKLKSVSEANDAVRLSLSNVDQSLSQHHEELSKLKQKLANLKKETVVMKERSKIAKNDLLVKDYVGTEKEIDMMRTHLSNLKLRHSELSEKIINS